MLRITINRFATLFVKILTRNHPQTRDLLRCGQWYSNQFALDQYRIGNFLDSTASGICPTRNLETWRKAALTLSKYRAVLAGRINNFAFDPAVTHDTNAGFQNAGFLARSSTAACRPPWVTAPDRRGHRMDPQQYTSCTGQRLGGQRHQIHQAPRRSSVTTAC